MLGQLMNSTSLVERQMFAQTDQEETNNEI